MIAQKTKKTPNKPAVKVIIATQKELDIMDDLYWSRSSVEERFKTVTSLRECFYGREATTGNIQRIYTMFKLK